jgi:hypothetical protein
VTLIPGLAAAVILVWALGGDLGRVTSLRFRRTILLYAALAGQLVAFGPARFMAERQVEQMQLATYALLLAFCFVNRRMAGLWLVALGIALNALVIAVNGGVMPVEPKAILASGWTPGDYMSAYPNVVARAGAPLWFLGDVFAMPRFPGSAVLSVGDISIVAGAWLVLQRVVNVAATARSLQTRRKRALAAAAGGLIVAALLLAASHRVLGAAAAAAAGAALAQMVLALSGRCLPGLRCFTLCALLCAAALALARSTSSGPTVVLGTALAGLVGAICVRAATTLLERVPAGASS